MTEIKAVQKEEPGKTGSESLASAIGPIAVQRTNQLSYQANWELVIF